MRFFVVLLPFILLLSGCSSTNSFFNQDVVEKKLEKDGVDKIGTLSLTSSRRIVVANLHSGDLCAEPPPETADAITSALTAALKANVEGKAEFNSEFAESFSKHVNQLYKRSHTVQFLRDTAFYYCIDAINNSYAIDGSGQGKNYPQVYSDDLSKLVDSLMPVLTAEVAAYYAVELEKAKRSIVEPGMIV